MTAAPAERLTMRTAIVHDWFQGYHGSERTAGAMLDVFAADPDILTFQAASDVLQPRLANAIDAVSAPRLITLVTCPSSDRTLSRPCSAIRR